jgi:hypothetical protein
MPVPLVHHPPWYDSGQLNKTTTLTTTPRLWKGSRTPTDGPNLGFPD